jgi:homogentisate 1,2-dioxygenase
MSEFMGLIVGAYEAKGRGLSAGGATLHNTMSAHGPDSGLFYNASQGKLYTTGEYDQKPERMADGTQSFMFECAGMLNLTAWAYGRADKSAEYVKGSWSGLKRQFDPKNKVVNVVAEGRKKV